ncbi:MAG: hypothetical protein OEZ09_01050, partial [Betaproteobacteria bacterium]|nr:hypothetical protein [Betaproteobacteria bacterium]
NIAERSKPISLDVDVKVVGPNGPRWETTASYAVTDKGDLWACVGGSGGAKSVLRRAKDGTYAVAILNNSVEFAPDLLGSEMNNQGLSLCALAVHPNGSLVLVGKTGLYRFDGNELSHELEFANTDQTIEYDRNKPPFHWWWEPSTVIALAENAYVISAMFGGVYLLAGNEGKTWSFEPLDEKLGAPVDW